MNIYDRRLKEATLKFQPGDKVEINTSHGWKPWIGDKGTIDKYVPFGKYYVNMDTGDRRMVDQDDLDPARGYHQANQQPKLPVEVGPNKYGYDRRQASNEPKWAIEETSTKVQNGTKVELTALLKGSEDKPKKVTLDLPDLRESLVIATMGKLVALDSYYKYDGMKYKVTELNTDYDESQVTVYGTLHVKGGPFDCNMCEGTGYEEHSTDEYSHSSGHYTRDRNIECEECKGDGKVDFDEFLSIGLKPDLEIDQERGTWIPTTYQWEGEQE